MAKIKVFNEVLGWSNLRSGEVEVAGASEGQPVLVITGTAKELAAAEKLLGGS